MKSFMFECGMTCPVREALENAGYVIEVLQAKLSVHEAKCKKCKEDLAELYRTGFLNG